MYQFFIDSSQMIQNTVTIVGKDVNHIRNVLRMKCGEEIAVSNGVDEKEYRCMIESITEDQVYCRVIFVKEEGLELPAKVYLFQGMPKGDKTEFIIQKAVELGVYGIIPMATRRAVVKLDEKKSKAKITRWQGIAEAAAKQSKRGIIPSVMEIMSFKEAIDFASGMDIKVIPYEMAEGMKKTKELIQSMVPGQTIAVLIGPEGGFGEEEVQMAAEAGIVPITMGKRILRTETAGLTILGWIMYQLES